MFNTIHFNDNIILFQVDSRPSNELVSSLIDTKQTIDTKMMTSHLTLFKVRKFFRYSVCCKFM